MKSIPVMVLLALPWFLADVRGYSKTYPEFGKHGYWFENLMDLSVLNMAAAAPGAEEAGSPFRQKLLHCCGSTRWVAEMSKRFPVRDFAELCQAADAVDASLTREDWLEAFAAHPRATKNADDAVLDRLEELNNAYYKKFGYIYIVCATGKSAPEMLRILETRMDKRSEDELPVAAGEQSKITKIRLEKLLQE
ncbi:uncharacterized protein PITG_22105 [Phytophthora infestans T30-4]|uniref:2-oxo-4-hydroxy-4-carboxy-5-ureidoimidazoline decarboxylase n=1 Tax=Phytophthora infestans (strain T30-4) TaxID=403677 RepID=D0P4Y6_PHYIT|nr:uncharacterized protein PITG_22105 [Phytophthora infestans T30-4]EEY54648.1 conserved hypothetical protein [Phytophthora infestans T30-4]|eukprot:XP_002894712.1 conserved hypothetical protein [Phytophthora infestans T30-4]